jgi:hypothetical protein
VIETLKRRKLGIFRAIPVPDQLLTMLSHRIPSAGAVLRAWARCEDSPERLV